MRIRILGCMGAYPARGSACNGYLISCAGKNLLLDCGPGTLGKLVNGGYLKDLDAVLLTHLHFDHMSDVLPMQYALSLTGGQIDTYLPATPKEVFDTVSLCSCLKIKVFDGKSRLDLGGIVVEFLPVRHPVECYAVKVAAEGKTLVYTSDCKYSDSLAGFCKGADIVLADAAQSDIGFADTVPHMSISQGQTLKEAAQPARLLLTHFSPLKDTREEISRAGMEYAEEDKEYWV